ncbi:sulfotransferase [Methylovulum psychrotolerans]|uniref:Sulfotransferase n=1 Tax=Methylovulum psychrotolerans TaxID=1704499 RepID=A0A1Z4C309_9GAMM|nr:sulfotransferase [Methylovulum psychrotolerans]ASF47880.1 hypothetical protein CEK71_18410 [Methylovulum psychrotolerans]
MNPLPSFLCVGVQKAGTSWLYEQLRQHPEIWLPPIKELHYFDHLYCPANRAWTQWHIEQSAKNLLKDYLNQAQAVDFRYVRYLATMASKPLFTEAWYRQAFTRRAARGKLLGDITPEYCAIGDEGILYMKRLLGAVKVLWMIRDPLDRALSQLRMNAGRRGLSADTPASTWLALAEDPEVAERGNYADYIPRWERHLGRDAMLFIPFRQIGQQPEAVLQTVGQFLQVTPWQGYQCLHEKVHASPPYPIPEAAVSYLSALAQPQYRFLRAYFPAEFMQAI